MLERICKEAVVVLQIHSPGNAMMYRGRHRKRSLLEESRLKKLIAGVQPRFGRNIFRIHVEFYHYTNLLGEINEINEFVCMNMYLKEYPVRRNDRQIFLVNE